MGGGLMQLVAYGAQDIYLTGNPQITFFKVVYRRHTNFSMESIQQTWNGSVELGGRVTSTISRNGDLISRCYVTFSPFTVIKGTGANPYCGNGLLKEVSVEIGGQLIDKHYGHWLTTWHELTSPNTGCTLPLVAAGGKFATAIPTGVAAGAEISVPPTAAQREAFYCKCTGAAPTEHYASVPLQFWFCRNPGLALPLIALQYHEVKIIVQIGDGLDVGPASTAKDGNMALWVDYIYLDTDERRRFAQVSHEYLIEQLQYQNTSSDTSMKLNFNHPVKEIIWAKAKAWGSASINGGGQCLDRMENDDADFINQADSVCKINLKLNGHDRFAPRHTGYFTRTQVAAHHSGNGGVQKADSIHVYSFALKPEEHQPSGTCNFSRIDNAQLIYTNKPTDGGSSTTSCNIHIYAVNYNVLRIMSGMGGLAYSN